MRFTKNVLVVFLTYSLLVWGLFVFHPARTARAQSTFAPWQCSSNFAINGTASEQLVTAANSSSFVYVCAFMVGTGGTAETGSLVEGTGTTCATNTKAMIGNTTSAGFPVGASPVQTGGGVGYIAKTVVAGDNVCLLVSGASALGGNITFAQANY